nr:MAG TPA: hypothetical protein [Caudoviricetes sp.]
MVFILSHNRTYYKKRKEDKIYFQEVYIYKRVCKRR